MDIGSNKILNQLSQQQFVSKMTKVIKVAKHLHRAKLYQMPSLILVYHCKNLTVQALTVTTWYIFVVHCIINCKALKI